ncbi:MAG: transcription antitermination factor NusB [bacterium]|nr:transcription antitermination factor NusB [bacterium]
MPHHERRIARVLAFNCQYQRQRLGQNPPAEALLLETSQLSAKNLEFTRNLLSQVQAKQSEIDQLIGRHSKNWKQSRLLETLNALLRISIAELMLPGETDTKVVFNEAIEICRNFVGERSVKLLNGILNAVSLELRPTA